MNIGHLRITELTLPMPLSATHEASAGSVVLILRWRNVLKVCRSVVGFIAIFVVYLMANGAFANEGSGNDPVYQNPLIAEGTLKIDLRVAIALDARLQNDLAGGGVNPSEIADSVGTSPDGFPVFGKIELNHDAASEHEVVEMVRAWGSRAIATPGPFVVL